MTDLKVPYAIDIVSGLVVKACNASKHTTYSCLECGKPLSLRDGEVNRKHFAHPATDHPGCQGESLTHKAAKEVLARQVRLELEDNGKIFFQQNCAGFEDRSCERQSLITGVQHIELWTEVALEVAYKSFRLDVAVVNGSDVVYGFEVFHRHKVPEPKANQLEIPWMELVAEDILAFKPRMPYGYTESSSLCPDCTELKQYLVARKPEDEVRQKTSEDYLQHARKLQATWRSIIEDAKQIDRDTRS